MLSKRETEILLILINENEITLDELSENFNLSKRSIQYDIANINYYLKKNSFSKISIKKSKINVFSKEELSKLLEEMQKYELIDKNVRKDLIKIYALYNSNGLNISNLAKKMLISRNTLRADMKELEGYKFNYVYSKGYFLNLRNSEKIDILNRVYTRNWFKNYINEILDLNLIHKIENFIIEISKEIELNINEEMYQKLIITIYTYLLFEEKDSIINNFNFGEEYKIIKKYYKKFFKKEKGLNVVYDMLIGLSLSTNLETWLDESFILKKLIKKVSDKININLTQDDILYDFLFSHIRVAIYRLKKNIELVDSVYQSLILKDDPLLEIVKSELKDMEEAFEIKFSNVEISLISYHFKASIERMKIYNRKKVILVCGLGYGTSRLLEYSLKDEFDIDIVDVIPSYMLSEEISKNKNVDYILSTIELNFEHIKINPILKIEDYEKLEKLGIKRKKEKIFIEDLLDDIENLNREEIKKVLLDKYSQIFTKDYNIKKGLLDFLDNKRVIFIDKIDNLKQGIELVGKNLEKLNSTNSNYTDSMIDMYNKFGTYMVIEDSVAMPHAKSENGVLKTDISVLILKNPLILEDGRKIKIFFGFSTVDNKEHLGFLNDIYKLVLDKNFVEKLNNIENYYEFINYIKEINFER